MPETLDSPTATTGEDSSWLPRSRRSPALARRLLRQLLANVRGGERFVDVGQLLLSELVTNALLHGTRRGKLLWVRLHVNPERLRIEVHDAGGGHPAPCRIASPEESGRGLMLVEALAAEWGVCPRKDAIGKYVWLTITPQARDGGPRRVAPRGEQLASHARPVTVELTGITPPATFARVCDALAALWESMRVLPLGTVQYEAYELFLTRPDAVERALEFLDRDGDLTLSFALPDGPHHLRVRPAAPDPST